MKRVLAILLFAAASARADGLGDLRAALARFPAQSTIRAAVTLEKHQEDDEHKTPEHGKVTVDVESGAEGLRVTYANELVARAQAEARAAEADAEKTTPVATALRSIDAPQLVAALDGAGDLARTLMNATLQKDQRIAVAGRPARQLTFALKPNLSKADAKHVKSAEMTLVVTADAENVPTSAELHGAVKAKFFLISFEQKFHRTWAYARAGDRLVAVQHREEQSGSGMGQNFSGWTATSVTVR
ncbi:MAG TPA: hypothetical protein VJZ76_04565 [Thermoanaerobaculia bacterium]|nr:hypothetical protein [Thermoanaerobaculia bacterium]